MIQKTISSILIVFSFLAGAWAINDRFATLTYVKESNAATEQRVVQTLETFQKSLERKDMQNRFVFLTDQLITMKILLYKNPTNKDLQQDIKSVDAERAKIKQILDSFK